MNTNTELLFKEEVFQIVGCAFEVLKVLGHGLNEKNYENALTVEFGLKNIPYRQQPRFVVDYKQCPVGEFVPDLIVFGKIIADPKVLDRITDHECGQMLNYLRVCN
jgi:GxxExxY protein